MRPFAAQQACAASIIAEIGADLSALGTAQRLAAWAGVCPDNHESAGKRKRRGTRKGNTYLKATLVTAAVSASQAKGTHPRDKVHRLKAGMGMNKAATAVAHKSWPPCSTCRSAASPPPIPAVATSTASTSTARPSAWSNASGRSAAASCSNPKPQP